MHLRLVFSIATVLISALYMSLAASPASAQVVGGGSAFQEWDFSGDGSACSTGNEDDNIVWGTSVQPTTSCADSEDDNIVWGTSADGAEGDDNIVWGTDDDNIVWGTSIDGAENDDNIVWGTGRDDNIVWGTRVIQRR